MIFLQLSFPQLRVVDCGSAFWLFSKLLPQLRIKDYGSAFQKISNMNFTNLFCNSLPTALTSLHLGITETILDHWYFSLLWSRLSKYSLHRKFVNLINIILLFLCHYWIPFTSMITMFNINHNQARDKKNSYNRRLKVGYLEGVDRLWKGKHRMQTNS